MSRYSIPINNCFPFYPPPCDPCCPPPCDPCCPPPCDPCCPPPPCGIQCIPKFPIGNCCPNVKGDPYAWELVQLPATGTSASLATNQYAWVDLYTQNIKNGSSIVSVTFVSSGSTGTLTVLVNTGNVCFGTYLIEGTLSYSILSGSTMTLMVANATPVYTTGPCTAQYSLVFTGVTSSLFLSQAGIGTLSIKYTNKC